MGERWWEDYHRRLAVLMDQVKETFRFGNGDTLVATERHRFPAAIAGMSAFVEACVVPSDSLVLLLGRDFLESVGAVADVVARRQLRVGSSTPDLRGSAGSHYSIDPDPATFRTAVASAVGSVGWDNDEASPQRRSQRSAKTTEPCPSTTLWGGDPGFIYLARRNAVLRLDVLTSNSKPAAQS